jgi:hypothetical protein
MANSAPMTMYRDELIAGFAKNQALLRETVVTEYEPKGGSAVFLVDSTSGDVASTRGLNGLIPSSELSLTQNTATLSEWHFKPRVSGFNIFRSQGNLPKAMQRKAMGAINRRADNDIVATLATGTIALSSGSAVAATTEQVLKGMTRLQNAGVSNDGNITLLCTPGFLNGLKQQTQFSSRDFVVRQPLANGDAAWVDRPVIYDWNGIKVISDPTLPGVGTATESNFLYHKNAVGQAIDSGGMQAVFGYDEEDDYSYARCTLFAGTVLLQNAGIVKITFDGTGAI